MIKIRSLNVNLYLQSKMDTTRIPEFKTGEGAKFDEFNPPTLKKSADYCTQTASNASLCI